jgi:hypothetical protein
VHLIPTYRAEEKEKEKEKEKGPIGVEEPEIWQLGLRNPKFDN